MPDLLDIPDIDGLTDRLLDDPQARAALQLLESSLYTFEPRDDRPDLYDEQTGALNSNSPVSVIIGGTGSGKTEVAGQKVGRFLLWHQPPPRYETPFWIVSNTYKQVGDICWKEKLFNIIPHHCIDWPRVHWKSEKEGHPLTVPLKPWAGRPGKNWVLEFKSFEQGRPNVQGTSIGGFWFSEQFPFDFFEEVLGRCRNYWYEGGGIVEFTPLDPDLSTDFEARELDPDPDWKFFRLNTDRNMALSARWKRSFFNTVSEEMLETRRTGAFCSYEGTIYRTFNPKVHVLDDAAWERETGCSLPAFPENVLHMRGADWGESKEHPFVCLWGFKRGNGDWYIYDEFFDDEAMLYEDRRVQIKKRWPWPGDKFHGSMYADPSRPGLINEFNCDGIPTLSASNSWDPGVEYVRRLLRVHPETLRPRLFIHGKNCPQLVRSMRTYRWKKSSGSGLNPAVAKREPLKRGDDPADALRYLLYSDSMSTGRQPTSDSKPWNHQRHGVRLERKR